MTVQLLQQAKKVIAVELDPRMIAETLKQVQGTEYESHLRIVHGDAIKIDLPYFDVCVANIPYQISSPLVFKLLAHRPAFRCAVIMFQENRLEADSAEKTMYCRLSVNTQLLADVKQCLRVGRNNFRPPPKWNLASYASNQEGRRHPSTFGVGWACQALLLWEDKTLHAVLTTKSVCNLLMANFKTHCALKNIPVPDNINMKELVLETLEAAGLSDARAKKMSVDDFLVLLNAFNQNGIHFA